MLTEDLTPSREDDAEEYAGTFCSKARNDEWTTEIRAQLAQGMVGPTTIVGVLGATGVGKSSLLNALLDEAAVLPTSGSRGCTAAVVELTYNRALCPSTTGEGGTAPEDKVPIYKGKVEFMKLSDWLEELKLLVDECSTQNQTIYARPPEEQNQPDAAAGWAKIDQVYGRGTYVETRIARRTITIISIVVLRLHSLTYSLIHYIDLSIFLSIYIFVYLYIFIDTNAECILSVARQRSMYING